MKFSQKARLKPCIDMNAKLRITAKSDFEKSLKPINNSVFGKTMENVRKHRNIKLLTNEKRRRSYLTQYITKFCYKNLKQSNSQNKVFIDLGPTFVTKHF